MFVADHDNRKLYKTVQQLRFNRPYQVHTVITQPNIISAFKPNDIVIVLEFRGEHVILSLETGCLYTTGMIERGHLVLTDPYKDTATATWEV